MAIAGDDCIICKYDNPRHFFFLLSISGVWVKEKWIIWHCYMSLVHFTLMFQFLYFTFFFTTTPLPSHIVCYSNCHHLKQLPMVMLTMPKTAQRLRVRILSLGKISFLYCWCSTFLHLWSHVLMQKFTHTQILCHLLY